MAKVYQQHGMPVSKKEAERLQLNPGVTPKGYRKRDDIGAEEGCGHYNGGARNHLLKPLGRLRDGKARRWIVPVHYSPNL